MDKLKRFLENTPAFLYLLPLFFVLHVIGENYGVNLIKDAFRVLSTYLIIALIFSIFFWLLLKNFHKANLMAFFVLAFNFFFGTTHDFLKQQDALSFFAKYGFLL